MFKLSELVKLGLVEYMNLLKSSVDYMMVYQTTTSYKQNIKEDFVEVFSDGEKYYLFDEGRFFCCGNIDNGNLIQTVIDDTQRFGFVMLALKHLENDEYLSNLLDIYEAEFCEELSYMLGYSTVKLDDGTILPLRGYLELFVEGAQQLSS